MPGRIEMIELTAANSLHNSLYALESGAEIEFSQSVLVGTLLGMSSWMSYSDSDIDRICRAHRYFNSLSSDQLERVIGEAGMPVVNMLFERVRCDSH